MIEFLAFIFACAFGFGLAFWIAATLLNKSNNYGDYHAEADHYFAHVNFTVDESLKSGEGRERYSGMSGYKKTTLPLAPKGKGLIQKSAASQVQHAGQNKASSKTSVPEGKPPADAPESVPKRRAPSSFPRSFRDV